jgi:hypothetical protein
MAIAIARIYWLHMLLKDLPVPPKLWCDIIGALALTSNPVYHACTKHIEVNYHFTREKVVNKDIIIRFISTHDQLAEGLSSNHFSMLRSKLNVTEPPISL